MMYQPASYDTLLVAFSVGLSLLGCFAALVSAIRIPLSSGRGRLRWTTSASVSLGGGAIWSMHFIGMTAYHLGGMEIVYQVPLTVLSLVIAIGASALGLSIVGGNPRSLVRTVAGGTTAGLGIAAMHYTGMAAMRTGSTIEYEPKRVLLSIGIAIGAAMAALFIAYRVRSKTHVIVASIAMTGAVCGMHYTAMTATRVEHLDVSPPMTGLDPLVMSLVVCLVAFTVLASVIVLALGGLSDASSFSLAKTAVGTERSVTRVSHSGTSPVRLEEVLNKLEFDVAPGAAPGRVPSPRDDRRRPDEGYEAVPSPNRPSRSR